jgi:hypothetical protein
MPLKLFPPYPPSTIIADCKPIVGLFNDNHGKPFVAVLMGHDPQETSEFLWSNVEYYAKDTRFMGHAGSIETWKKRIREGKHFMHQDPESSAWGECLEPIAFGFVHKDFRPSTIKPDYFSSVLPD